jgi:ligand-binding sensor domain-containing protein
MLLQTIKHPFILFISIILFSSSCNAQSGAETPNAKQPDPLPAFLPELDPPPFDPYFYETDNAVSTHGPESITRNILQDKNGTIWLASWQGIVSYDGEVYVNHTLKDKLSRFHVFSILEDRAGNIWFGTIRGGLYKYDGRSFALYTMRDGLADNIIGCMMQDKAGNLWFGTDKGVSRYDGKKFTNFSTADGLAGNSVNWIMQDKTGRIWVGSFRGEHTDLCYYDGKSFTLFNKDDGTRFSNVRCIIEDRKGIIWFGGQDGLCRYDPDPKPTGKSMEILNTNFIGYIFEDRKGNLWLSRGVDSGPEMTLTLFDGKSFTDIARKPQVFGIEQDSSGKIWYGSLDGVFTHQLH